MANKRDALQAMLRNRNGVAIKSPTGWNTTGLAVAEPTNPPAFEPDYSTGRDTNPEDYAPYNPVTGRAGDNTEAGQLAVDPDPMDMPRFAPPRPSPVVQDAPAAGRRLSPDEIDALEVGQAA